MDERGGDRRIAVVGSVDPLGVRRGSMVDPTSDIGDVDPEDAPACAVCGAAVTGDDHRVRSWVEDSNVEHRHFCDDDCLEEWDG